jgi:hypothetical protein
MRSEDAADGSEAEPLVRSAASLVSQWLGNSETSLDGMDGAADNEDGD